MDYFVNEVINGDPTAGPKARNDISTILRNEGWKPITLDFVFDEKYDDLNSRTLIKKVSDNIALRKEWASKLKNVGKNDRLIIQIPVLRRPIALALTIFGVKRRGGKVYSIIHDLEMLRYNRRKDVSIIKKARIALEERSVLKSLDMIIVHNEQMLKKMKSLGFDSDKMISLQIFDYLVNDIEGIKEEDRDFEKVIAIAGTLRPHKCKYLLELPDDVHFNLYGVGYEDLGKKNVTYFGAFSPNELPNKIDASFGLVWDGDSATTCTGATGEYLKINNPHKTSLYLVSGIPVIIWENAALADFIIKNECGIVVRSLDEIGKKIAELTADDYRKMRQNAIRISKQLREGTYTKVACRRLDSYQGKLDETE